MTAVALGPKGKVVEIPDDMLAQFDSGRLNRAGLMDYALSTGQGRASDFGLDETKPDVSGPMNAAMISAGKETTQLGSNAAQLFYELSGAQGLAEKEKGKQAERERLTAPVSQQYPKSSFAGRVLPNFAVPGGLAPQIGAGVAQGVLASDTPGGRIGGGALGGALAYGGAKAGDALSRNLTPRLQALLGSRLGGARETLDDAGIPLTLGQRGSASGRFIDVLKSTLLRRQPLQTQQLRALTSSAAKVIGEESDELTKPVLSRAANRIGSVYEDIAKNVGAIDAIGPESAAKFDAIQEMLSSVPDPSKVTGAIKMVDNMIMGEGKRLTGASYNALRQRLGRISNQLWEQGSGLEAEVVDELMSTLDDALARSAPEAAEKLAQVRPQWRFLVALRRGAAIDDKTGLINPQAMNQAMESVYQGFDIGKGPSGAAGEFGKTLDAFRQVIQPFKSSGTAERLSGVAAPILAGIGLTGAGAGPIVGPAAMLALMLSGGGAGQQLGGGLGRTLAQQSQPMVDPTAQQLAEALRRIQ